MISGIPPGAFMRSMLLRAALVWAFVRAVVSGAATGLSAAGVGAELGPVAAVPIVFVVCVVVFADQYRRREFPFLRNLGVGHLGMLLPILLLAVMLEAVLAVVRVV